MLPTATIILTLYQFALVFGAAIRPQVVLSEDSSSGVRSSDGIQRLREALKDRVFPASPAARPCYADAFNREQCSDVTRSNRTDVWLSDQPGGYFYVSHGRHGDVPSNRPRETGVHVRQQARSAIFHSTQVLTFPIPVNASKVACRPG